MPSGRKPQGIEQVELLPGSTVAKQRLEVFLANVAGRLSVAEACANSVCKRRSSSSCGGAGWKTRWSCSSLSNRDGLWEQRRRRRPRTDHDAESADWLHDRGGWWKTTAQDRV